MLPDGMITAQVTTLLWVLSKTVPDCMTIPLRTVIKMLQDCMPVKLANMNDHRETACEPALLSSIACNKCMKP